MNPVSFELELVKEGLANYAARVEPTRETSAAAAVATILRKGQEGSEVLFIKRAEREGDPWSGDLAFPGGKKERADASLLVTALRETEEEVGLLLPPAACLARLDDVVTRTSYRVAQFAFALDDPDAAPVTSAEVTATLWVPLGRLARFEGAGTLSYVREGVAVEVPCLHLGGYVLWGMTYRMLLQLLDALGLPTR